MCIRDSAYVVSLNKIISEYTFSKVSQELFSVFKISNNQTLNDYNNYNYDYNYGKQTMIFFAKVAPNIHHIYTLNEKPSR